MSLLDDTYAPEARMIINHPHGACVVDNRGVSALVHFPTLGDGAVDALFEILDRLPEDFGLLLDRETCRMRLFQVADAGGADLGKSSVVKRAPGQSVDDDLSGEILQAEGEQTHPGRTEPQVRHSVPVRHLSILASRSVGGRG